MKVLLILIFLVAAVQGRESILLFKSEIVVNDDGWLDVTETIKVRVERIQIERGIYRDFPQVYKVKWGFKEKRPFEVQSVLRNGEVENYEVIRKSHGSRLRIGSKDRLLPKGSIQTYEIKYRTNYQLITDVDGVDELYWNVTGNEWGFPIEKVEAEVLLPGEIEIEEVSSWEGEKGSVHPGGEKDFEQNVAGLKSSRTLLQGEGMTISVRWPTGLLSPEAYQGPSLFASNPMLITGLGFVAASILVHLGMWFFVGRDPLPGTIIPRWDPPEGFSPGGVRYLRNLAFDDRCFTAGILGLAAEGKVNLTDLDGAYIVGKEEGTPPMDRVPNALFQKLFEDDDEVELVQHNHKIIGGAREKFAQALERRIDRTYFLANFQNWLPGLILGIVGVFIMLLSSHQSGRVLVYLGMMLFVAFTTFSKVSSTIISVRSRGWRGIKGAMPGAGSVAFLWLLAFGLFAYNVGAWIAVCFLLVFASSYLFHHLIKRPTKKGRRVLDEIEGFREYLKVAEEDRLNLENPPEKTPELFEKFLPYALALDVEQEWSEKFDDVLKEAGCSSGDGEYSPSYYTGSFSTTSQVFTGAAIGGALTSALTTASVAPSSTGGSSGGYSGGGGFSGGGGGGGGGGGW